eukprot:TRINITY_DN4677_c0_g1_i2.p1 TRINITY_DN4677_c0_g1~~TRINITY_DN4677_c0_g1_i2.p1  ORF type:complete len:487 (+),score=39.89 TRINITY_DN4677_c0_g1_i2:42-1502(+)
MNLWDIPFELFEFILSFLNVAEVLRLSKTNKLLNHLCLGSSLTWINFIQLLPNTDLINWEGLPPPHIVYKHLSLLSRHPIRIENYDEKPTEILEDRICKGTLNVTHIRHCEEASEEWIGGVKLLFPYPVYSVQRALLIRLLTALRNSGHAILESPTGTGKTLTLLCGALAWQRQHQVSTKSVCKIFYVSRTHKQLHNVVQELRKTPYQPSIAFFATRSRLCNRLKSSTERVSGEDSRNFDRECLDLVITGDCSHYQRLAEFDYALRCNSWLRELSIGTSVADIEDLMNFDQSGKEHGCSFYTSRLMTKDSHLVLSPYNYIFDPTVQKSLKIESDIDDSVLILDEGHNIESMCMDFGSFTVKAEKLEMNSRSLCMHLKKRRKKRRSTRCRYGYYEAEQIEESQLEEVILFYDSLVSFVLKNPCTDWRGQNAFLDGLASMLSTATDQVTSKLAEFSMAITTLRENTRSRAQLLALKSLLCPLLKNLTF